METSVTLEEKWKLVRQTFNRAFASSFHYAVATTDLLGNPHVTPIGSLLLDRAQPRGIYFEIFTRTTRKNIEANQRVCVLAVQSSKVFWIRSLLKSRFSEPPALRLHGKAGVRRKATAEEVACWRRRTRWLRPLPGYSLLWGSLTFVREIEFERAELIHLGKTTQHLELTFESSSV